MTDSPKTYVPIQTIILRSVMALGLRQIVVQGANIVGSILLARLLSPAEYGLYAITVFFLSFLIAFGDVGLGGSLVRQTAEPTIRDYKIVFNLQLVLVISVSTIMWLSSPFLVESYQLLSNDVWLFRFLALSLLFTTFQTIPLVFLERSLKFEKIAIIEIAQAVIYNTLLITMVYFKLGNYVFGLALALRALTGALLAYFIHPWSIGSDWDIKVIREHMKFGLAYQGSKFISLIKDSVSPVIVGFISGRIEVGFINWATAVSSYSVLLLNILQRIYLPAFSRMQSNRRELSKLVEDSIWGVNAFVAPLSILTLVLIQPITIIVFGDKWLKAIPFFILFWAANIFVPTSSVVQGVLNALGFSGKVFRYSVIWMLGTWIISVPLIIIYGGIGFAIANFFVQLTNIWFYKTAQKELAFVIIAKIYTPWFTALGSGILVGILEYIRPAQDILNLIIYFLLGLLIYGIYIIYKFRNQFFIRLGLLKG